MSDEYNDMTDDELWDYYNEANTFEKGQILFHFHHRRTHEGEYRNALTYAEQAFDLYKNSMYAREAALAKRLMGHSQKALKEYEPAIDSYKESADLSLSCGADSDTARTENFLGDLYWCIEDFEQASVHYRSSEKIFESIDDHRGAAMSAREDGDALVSLGKFREAVSAYLRSIESAKAAELPHSIYSAYFNLAYAYMAMNFVPEALDAAQKAMALAKTCACPNCEVESLVLLGEVNAMSRNYEEAESLLRRANQIYHDRSDAKQQSAVLVEMGISLIRRVPFSYEAREHLEQANVLVEMFPKRLRTKVRANYGLGRIALLDFNYETASEHLALAYNYSQESKRLIGERHRLLPYYLDSLLGIEAPEEVIKILNEVANENDSWSLIDGQRYVYAARAYMMMNDHDLALQAAENGLNISLKCQLNNKCKAMLHQIRSEVLQESDPRSAAISAQKALAYFVASGEFHTAQEIAQKTVIQPDLRTAEIAEHENSRNTYDELFGASDPIAEQIDGLIAQVDPTREQAEGEIA